MCDWKGVGRKRKGLNQHKIQSVCISYSGTANYHLMHQGAFALIIIKIGQNKEHVYWMLKRFRSGCAS